MAAVRPLAGSLPQSLPKPGFPSQNPSLVTSPYLSVKISANPQLVSRYMCRNCAAWTDVEFVKSFTVTKIPNFCQFYPQKTRKLRHFGPKINNGNFTNGVIFCVLSWKFYPSPKIFYTNVICDFFDNFHVWSWTEVLKWELLEHIRPSLYSEQQDRQDTPFFERQGGDTKDTVMENHPYCLNCNFLLFGWGWPDAWCPSLLHIHMHVIEIQLQKVACTLNRSSIIDAIFRDLLMRGFHLESKFSHATYMQSARSWV